MLRRASLAPAGGPLMLPADPHLVTHADAPASRGGPRGQPARGERSGEPRPVHDPGPVVRPGPRGPTVGPRGVRLRVGDDMVDPVPHGRLLSRLSALSL